MDGASRSQDRRCLENFGETNQFAELRSVHPQSEHYSLVRRTRRPGTSAAELFAHIRSRHTLFMKAAFVQRIGLADEDVGCHFVFGATELSKRGKQREIIESFQG